MAKDKTTSEVLARKLGVELIDRLHRADAQYVIVADRHLRRHEQQGDEEIDRYVRELDEVLRDLRLPTHQQVQGDHWTLGWRTFARRGRRIPGGSVIPILRVPIYRRPSTSVVSFLITLPGGADYLKRERHGEGVGWALPLSRRQEAALRCPSGLGYAPAATPLTAPRVTRPLFHEKHGDGRCDFEGRPHRWGDKKKEAMYKECDADVQAQGWPMADYRCASNDADVLWPKGAVLTPRP